MAEDLCREEGIDADTLPPPALAPMELALQRLEHLAGVMSEP